MSIKVLFLLMVLSVAAVIGVAVAAFFHVRWHWKARHTIPQASGEQAVANPTENRRSAATDSASK